MSVGFVVRWGRNGRISAENFFFEACGDMVKVRENIPEMETFNREETAQGSLYAWGICMEMGWFFSRNISSHFKLAFSIPSLERIRSLGVIFSGIHQANAT